MAKDQKQETTQQEKAGSSDDFFQALESQVNGAIQEPTTEEVEETGPEEVTQNNETEQVSAKREGWESSDNPYKKRYGDSSKEARKMNEELESLKPFVPLLNAMRQDGGLVDHVKNYLVSGGAPAQSIQSKLELDENFVFDAQEAVTTPDSDSAKVLNSHVDALISRKVGGIIEGEKKVLRQKQATALKSQEETNFKKKFKMSDDEFGTMVEKAKTHTLTLEDVYYLMNKDKASQNVASNTKQDMLNQMKNFQDMPTSVSGVNSAGKASKSEDDQLFESILGSDGNLEGLFG